MKKKRIISTRQEALPITGEEPIRQVLRERLLSLNFHAFCRLIGVLLERMDFEDVLLSGRTDWKGRNGRDGNTGYDLTAYAPGGMSRRKVIIQVKQFDEHQKVFQKSVDELRGTCLRVGAAEALLITTGGFSAPVHRLRNLLHESPVAPVRLMDGERLLDEMLSRQVGVVQGDTEQPWEPSFYRIDDALFESLSQYEGNSRLDCLAPGQPQFLVTVAVQPLTRSSLRAAKALTT